MSHFKNNLPFPWQFQNCCRFPSCISIITHAHVCTIFQTWGRLNHINFASENNLFFPNEGPIYPCSSASRRTRHSQPYNHLKSTLCLMGCGAHHAKMSFMAWKIAPYFVARYFGKMLIEENWGQFSVHHHHHHHHSLCCQWENVQCKKSSLEFSEVIDRELFFLDDLLFCYTSSRLPFGIRIRISIICNGGGNDVSHHIFHGCMAGSLLPCKNYF